MKTKCLILLLLAGIAFPLLSSAQDTSYRSCFGNEFTRWYVYNNMLDCYDWSELYITNNQDTILPNGISYKKVYRVYSLVNWNPDYAFGIREEPATGSLFVNKDGDLEELISKMNLGIGDKFYFPSTFVDYGSHSHFDHYFKDFRTDDNGHYATVDSVYYEDERKHIRLDVIYHAFEFDSPLTFIEGIGPNVSFMPLLSEFSMAVGFHCYENESGLWKSKIKNDRIDFSELEECFLERTGIPKIEAGFPVLLIIKEGKIELQTDAAEIKSGQVYVYSAEGKLVHVQHINGGVKTVVSTSGFSSGVYIIRVQDGNTGKSWSRKVII